MFMIYAITDNILFSRKIVHSFIPAYALTHTCVYLYGAGIFKLSTSVAWNVSLVTSISGVIEALEC